RRPRIGIVGPPPAPGVLPETVPVTVINNAIVAGEKPDRFLVDHVGHVSQSVRMILPDVEFVFSQVKSDIGSMTFSALLQASNAMFVENHNKPIDIVVFPYRGIEAIAPVVPNAAALDKTLFVVAAGNEGFNKDAAV